MNARGIPPAMDGGGVPTLAGGGVPTLAGWVPTLGIPHPDLAGGTYLGRGVPTLGYPPSWPGWGVPTLVGGYLPWGTTQPG